MKLISAKTIIGLPILLLTAACSDELAESPSDGTCPIAFTPSAETRAAVDGTTLPSNSSFNVWGWYGTDGEINKNVFNGTTVTESKGSWGYSEGTQYWIKDMTYNFYGVYPADVTASVENNGTITVDDFDCSKEVDFMTATHTRNYDGTNADPVSMTFNHELARVKVSVESNGAIVDGLKVYGVGYIGNFKSKTSPKWTVTGTADKGSTPLSGTTELDMLLLPATDLNNAKLEVSYHYGTEATATRTDEASLAIAGGWTAGQQYHYKVSIVAGKLSITVTVADWKEEDTSVSWG